MTWPHPWEQWKNADPIMPQRMSQYRHPLAVRSAMLASHAKRRVSYKVMERYRFTDWQNHNILADIVLSGVCCVRDPDCTDHTRLRTRRPVDRSEVPEHATSYRGTDKPGIDQRKVSEEESI